MTFTFDTGMLIALERRKSSAIRAFQSMVRRGHVPVVPAPVYAEWWRGKTAVREDLSKAFSLEPMSSLLCRATGEALAAVRGATLVDACVMASAALRGGGIVYTADVDDLRKLQALFPTVALIAV